MVTHKPQRCRDGFQAHYTTAPEIVSYMVSTLALEEDDFVWEPCAGEGNLVDGLLSVQRNVKVRASEIESRSVVILKIKYQAQSNVEIFEEDALVYGDSPLFEPPETFNKIIANPPYGAYQTLERRSQLKKKYPELFCFS